MKPLIILLSICSLSLSLAEEGFTSLFNGKDLSGWDGDPALWDVKDGIVVGTCDGPDAFESNTFLIWQGGTVKDFELRATIRVIGDNNSGVQYRSHKMPEVGKWAIAGYQCDVHPAIQHTGMTYEEKGRGMFGLNGNNVLLDPEGNRWLLSKQEPVKVDTSEWNEFTVIARGNHLIHKVNGKVTSEFFDHHEGLTLEGLVAIQLHRGNPHRVEIKELKVKTLDEGKVLAFDPAVLKNAKKIERPKTSNPQGTGPVAPQSPKVLLKEDFEAGLSEDWFWGLGTWSAEAGVMRGFESGKRRHGPVKMRRFAFTDGVMDFDFFLEGDAQFAGAIFNGSQARGHIFHLVIAKDRLRLIAHPKKGETVELLNEPYQIEQGKWHTARLVLKGEEAIATLDGTKTVRVSHPCIAEEKLTFGLGGDSGGPEGEKAGALEFRGLKLSALE